MSDSYSTIARFREQFLQKVGFIKSDGGNPVQLLYVIGSWHSHYLRCEEFGCRIEDEAFLAEWIPAGIRLDWDYEFRHGNEKVLEVTYVTAEKISPRENWIVFPATFQDRPIHYRKFRLANIPELREP